MSELFNSVKPGDTVHYRTPQGVTAKGKVVMNRGTHLVLNRGRGSPQVVTDKNYVKHERSGKVVGALLSRLSVKEATWQGAGDPYNWDPVMRAQIFAAAKKKAQSKFHGVKPHELDTGRQLKTNYKGPPPRRGTTSEDSHDAEGHEARIAKTKHKKKKLVSEVSAPGQESWIKANKARFVAKYGKEKGTKILYAKAWKMSKNESVNKAVKPSFVKLSLDYHEASDKPNTVPPRTEKHFSTVEKAKKFAEAHHGKPLKWKDNGWGHVAKHGNIYKGKTYTIEPIQIHEARENEWTANQQLAGTVSKPAKGHYLMRDGRRLSGPHSPEEAVKQYKNMSDSKGVKIVHVKEASEKVKKAAEKAIRLAKKGTKVDTKPALHIPDKGTSGPLEGTHADKGADDAKI